ncbi:MAG: DEAD/DEAH box helicase family protein [Malacoplasma sp.]|nr:DEAD/DEAH box helicase family protein [Malacoplasma sp.]
MPKTEKETRLKLIDPALKRAGWILLNEKYIIEKNRACIETPVKGMIKTSENPSGEGFVDYVLFGDDGRPLALIEAKRSVENEEHGRVQACLYADALEKKYGIRPVIYYTNGYSINVIDGLYPPREVFGFHRKEELEFLIQRRDFKLDDKEVDDNICSRYYQKDAIAEVIKHLGTKNSRSLIVLATGTGKTRVSCAISDIFLRNNYVKRILFLADRRNLVRQAKQETFEKFLPTVPMSVIADGYKEGEESKARIVFATYQSMISIIKDLEKCPYGIGHFDLIIVDEAHRSLFRKYGEIFDYFDALMIGLTATPKNDINKSTFKVFNLNADEPNYEYDVRKGVKDGYLTYYRAYDRTPKIFKDGLVYDSISEKEKEEYEDKFTEEDGTLPAKIEGDLFKSCITNRSTIRQVLKDLMEEGLYVDNGDVLGKTIIFARDHYHALIIQEEFRKLYPELCNLKSPNGVDYCVVIDNKIKYNEVLQNEFKYKQTIRIVVSVDMMDTGVDIPEIVNLVFFKRIASKIKFWQMIGRGTRLCDNIKVLSPSKAYFERKTNDNTRQIYSSKQGFLIFDICNVFPFFKQNVDGKPDKSDQVFSLYQSIFVVKVYLYKLMLANYEKLDLDDKKYLESLRDELIDEVKKLNPSYIGVNKNLKYVEKYCELSTWLNFDHQNFVEVKKYIALNVQGEIDEEKARRFDKICYQFAAAKFIQGSEFKKASCVIYIICDTLIKKKSHITEVASHINTLKYVASDTFINNATVTYVDKIRQELRDLMVFLDPSDIIPLVSDFKDEISTFEDAEENEVNLSITVDDFKTLSEKVNFLIENNPDLPLVKQIQNLIKPTNDAIQDFRSKVVNIAKTTDEFNELFKSDQDANIVIFVRKKVKMNSKALEDFINQQKNKGLNELQIGFIEEVFEFIFQNGFLNITLFMNKFNYQINNLFNSNEIKNLIKDIENRI